MKYLERHTTAKAVQFSHRPMSPWEKKQREHAAAHGNDHVPPTVLQVLLDDGTMWELGEYTCSRGGLPSWTQIPMPFDQGYLYESGEKGTDGESTSDYSFKERARCSSISCPDFAPDDPMEAYEDDHTPGGYFF